MNINEQTLPSIEDPSVFCSIYTRYVEDSLAYARFSPRFSPQRLIEAHGAWMNDLSRVGVNEPQLDEGLDHFKRCGHLAFWLRRMAPLIDVDDNTQNISDSEGLPITNNEQKFRDLLFGYANEYLAFDFGYQLCKFHEISRQNPSKRATELTPDTDYYKVVCHFLKYKTVSPHAMYLIYKSLFAA